MRTLEKVEQTPMKIVATIEARLGSTRLPRKVIKPLLGEPMLARIIERVLRSKRLNEIVVATTVCEEDTAVAELAQKCGVSSFRGDEHDILERLDGALRQSGADIQVSLTGDNPFVDPELIDDMVDCLLETGVDYVASTHMQHARNWGKTRTFPTGVSVQVVRVPLVLAIAREVTDPAIRELGLYAIYDDESGRFNRHAFSATGKYRDWCYPELRMTVDTLEDFQVAERIYGVLYPETPGFSTANAIRMLVDDPDLRKMNGSVVQRVGYETLDEARAQK